MAFQPTPGQKNPGKYPVKPGAKYDYYGEQPGWIYDPYTDNYARDPQAAQDYYEETGLAEREKKPGLGDQLLPIGAAALALEGGRQVGAGAIPFATETLPGMFGGAAAETGTVAGTTAATAPTAGAGVATSGGGAGLMGGAAAGANTVIVPAGAAIPEGYVGVQTLANGGTLAAPAGEAASAGWGAYAAPAAAAAGIAMGVYGAYQGYDTAKDIEKETGTRATQEEVAAGHDYTGIEAFSDKISPKELDFMHWNQGKIVSKLLGSHKHEDQTMRDRVRVALQKAGALDEDWNITLADGTKVNLGLDGDNKITSAAGNEVNPYDVDWSDPNAQQSVEWLNGLGALMGGGNKKAQSDLVGQLTNAAQKSGNTPETIRANAQKFYSDLGINPQNAAAELAKLVEDEKISQQEADIYLQGINKLFDPNSGFEVAEVAALEPLPPAPIAPQPAPSATPQPPGMMGPGPASLPEGQPSAVSQTPAAAKPGLMITGMPNLTEEEKRNIATYGKARPGMMGGGY